MTTATDYARLLAERDSRARVAMDVARDLLRPGDWNRDNMTLRRLAYVVRQHDHVNALLDQHDAHNPIVNVRPIAAYGPREVASGREQS